MAGAVASPARGFRQRAHARSGGPLERDIQTPAEVVADVESGDHAAVEAALLGEVDGAQVRLRVARSGPFDQALHLRVGVSAVRVVDREPGHFGMAQGHDGPFVEPLERFERFGRVRLTQFALGLGIDDHHAHLPMFA